MPNNNTAPQNKLLFACGITCAICGLIIFAVTLFDSEPVSSGTIWLGIINIINGCLFLGLSTRNQKK